MARYVLFASVLFAAIALSMWLGSGVAEAGYTWCRSCS